MKREELNIDYALYEDGTRYLGTTEVTLPNIAFKTAEMTGAGVAGTVETIVLGHIECALPAKMYTKKPQKTE